MQYTQNITLDVNGSATYRHVAAKQGDNESRVLVVTLIGNGEQIVPETGVEANFRCLKPDGNSCLNPATINEDGTITVELTSQVLACKGTTKADVSLVKDDTVLSSATFYIEVEAAPISSSTTTSSDEFLTLVEALDRIDDADTTAATALANSNSALDNLDTLNAAEASRVSAESSRVSAEDIRVSAESGRDTAEQSRVLAETGRVSAEAARVSAENVRNADGAVTTPKIADSAVTPQKLSEIYPPCITLTTIADLPEASAENVGKLFAVGGETGVSFTESTDEGLVTYSYKPGHVYVCSETGYQTGVYRWIDKISTTLEFSIDTKQTKSLYFSDKSIASEDWAADTTYADYGYKCDIACTGVTTSMLPVVIFAHTEAISGNYSPIAVAGSGIVTVYSKVNTAITIPTIKCEVTS